MAHVCPAWIGYFLASPLRKIVQDPQTILSPFVGEGAVAADIGCGMGFFSIPLARMVGDGGKVICVDLQEKMLRVLEKRARDAGVSARVETILAGPETTGLDNFAGRIDFAMAFAVVHEVSDPAKLFSDISAALKPSGTLLVAEPSFHVSEKDFAATVLLAERHGLAVAATPRVPLSRSVLLQKKDATV